MQQQIGFCTTADGVRIAYATVGTGPAVVVSQLAPSHIGVEWEEPRVRGFWEAIGHHHLIVRYDKHGCGLSNRERTDFSLDFEVRTIEAIVKKLGLKSFVLWGQGGIGGAAAIAYAVKSPEPVSHLILCNAQARWRGASGWGGVSPETFRALARSDSRMASLAMLERGLGSEFDVPALQWFLRLNREGVTPEIYDQLVVAHVYDLAWGICSPESACQPWSFITATMGRSRSKRGANWRRKFQALGLSL
jgi:pimeloyl-ACP methyl ester carboxylesterase